MHHGWWKLETVEGSRPRRRKRGGVERLEMDVPASWFPGRRCYIFTDSALSSQALWCNSFFSVNGGNNIYPIILTSVAVKI